MILILIIFTDDDLPKIRARDPHVFEKIFKEYHGKIYNFLLIKTLGNSHTAEDLLSETFNAALIFAPKLSNAKNIQGWLIRIANNKFIDYYRKQKIRNKYLDSYDAADVAQKDTSFDTLFEQEKYLLLELALKNINPEYSRMISLKYLEHKNNNEIAKISSKTLSAVNSILFRAKKQLKKELSNLIKDYL